MDGITSAQVQMPTEPLSPLKLDDNDEQHIFEVDENQRINGLKRQRLTENNTNGIQIVRTNNKISSQTCGNEQTHENHLKTMRCLATATDSPPTNGMTMCTTTTTTSTQLKDTHKIKHSNDAIKSNGFNNHIENGINRENGISIPSDDCIILANLCDGQNEGYFDAMITSDLSDADMKLAIQKENCSENQIFSNGCDQNGDHVINRGHRRTRAHSSDSIQAEFYQASKRQLCLQSHNDSDVSF